MGIQFPVADMGQMLCIPKSGLEYLQIGSGRFQRRNVTADFQNCNLVFSGPHWDQANLPESVFSWPAALSGCREGQVCRLFGVHYLGHGTFSAGVFQPPYFVTVQWG